LLYLLPADAGYFEQLLRVFIDHFQRLRAKTAHDQAGKVRAYAFDQPGSQVALDPQGIHREDAAEGAGLELLSKTGVVGELAGHFHFFANRQLGKGAYYG